MGKATHLFLANHAGPKVEGSGTGEERTKAELRREQKRVMNTQGPKY